MAQVRHIVTAPGKDPVEFFAPEGANDAQLQQLASQALASQFPQESFVTPVLDAGTRKSLERAPRKLTQDEILSSQGNLAAPEENIRTRTADALTSVLSGLGMSNAAEKGRGFVDDVYDWTPAAALESGEEAIGDFAGGRYGEAIGNTAMAALDIVPELGTAVKGGSALAMFLGRNAKTANLDALRKAEQLAEQGADKRQIWDETGWFKGADGQWRFEISDEKLKVKDPLSADTAAKRAAKATAQELGYKRPEDIPYIDRESRTAVQAAGIDAWNANANGRPLRDLVSHPDLEATGYPLLDELKVSPLPSGSRNFGEFSPNYKSIQWKTAGRKAGEKRSTVAHELQHAVQSSEGFAGGAKAGTAAAVEAGPHYESAVRHRDQIKTLLDDPNTNSISKIQLRRMLPQAEEDIVRAAQYEGYRRVAGEVEARNVQSRLTMSDAERQATPPWETQDFPDEEQFVVFRGEGPQADELPPGASRADDSDALIHYGNEGDTREWGGRRQVLRRFPLDDLTAGEGSLPGSIAYDFPEFARTYAERDTPLPPIDVMRLDADPEEGWDAANMIYDGHKRVQAARMRGDQDILGWIDDDGVMEEAIPPGISIGPGKQAMATGKKTALGTEFEGVTDYDTALNLAQSGVHLRPDARGFLMGSPDVMPNALEPWRMGLDAKIANANQEGLGWYERGRTTISDVSDTPEMASLLARGGAVYSPQASPTSETNFFLRHHNQRVLTGEPATVTTADRAKAANLGYGPVGENSGFIQLTPEDITLGKKTGPYATSKDPTVAMGPFAANDLWHGRALGYAPDEGQTAFDRAFSDTEHAFLKGENTLATQRAREAGTLPSDATPANMQEVVWVEERKQNYLAEQNARYEAGKRKTPPTNEEALNYALEGIDTAVARNTASLSREFTPGGGLGEFAGLSSNPEANARFSAEMAAATNNPKNSVFQAMQLYQRPTVEGVGFWNDPVEGLQRNPAFVDRPLVGLTPEDVGGKPGGVAMDPHSKNAMMVAGRLFGIENLQHGVGANIFVPGNSSHKASQLNGLYFGPEEREAAMDQAVAAGLDVVDNGDGGIVVTSFNDDMAGAAKKVKEFGKSAGGRAGRFDANYAESGLSQWDDAAGEMVPTPQGQGIATKKLLEATDTIPGLEQRLASSSYPDEVAARNVTRQKMAGLLATSLRPDVQLLRDLLAQGGPARVRQWVAQNGWKGLPAWGAALLGGGAMLSAYDQDPQGQPVPL